MLNTFNQSDADAYYERNKHFLGSAECIDRDVPLKMIEL